MIFAIVATVSIGNSPTLVSPDSMRASAPSSTAFATSLASARVGRDAVIMDSSIWVATITGFAQRRQSSTARFCTSGTCSSGSSTPRSPRATITPSKASMISSRFSTAWGFSTFAIVGMWIPSSRIISCTRTMSEAFRTKESAIMSAPSFSAQRRSASSFSESAGTFTATPGKLIPLLLDTIPATSTTVVTVRSSTWVARRPTLPSSIRSSSPTFTSPGRPLKVVPQMFTSPSTLSIVILKVAPFSSMTGPSLNLSKRIFGP
ncbi:unannotated protein [freshwater metagenome]|uniref:Unannotated protein n=1 Tax=freshwater metagenome TaxID=449393 RepID=A0A6J6HTW8_9ZZZZ